MAGRPSKRQPETQAAIVAVLARGNTRTDAAAAVGISLDTFARWGHDDADFRAAVEKAEAEARIKRVLIIEKAARTSWQAAAWHLERRDNEHWGRRDHVTVDLRREAERLAETLEGVSTDELVAEAERIALGAK